LKSIKVGVIGCGVISELAHLPGLRALGVEPAYLIDPDLSRATRLAATFGGRPAADWREAAEHLTAAIVATPNDSHAPIAAALLRRGVHVLVEKPLGRTETECRSVLTAAHEGGARLTVGHRRRWLNASRWLARELRAGGLRQAERFELEEGYDFDWPVSRSFWERERAGGGVLLDMGCHVLDQVLWWFGPVADLRYADDACGGVEAECVLELTMASGVEGRVELSRTRRLRNSIIIDGAGGRVEAGLSSNWATCHWAGYPKHPRFARQEGYADIHAMLAEWLQVVEDRGEPSMRPEAAAEVIGLIGRCYETRREFAPPWLSAATLEASR
jgi:predicted dehydrogenase